MALSSSQKITILRLLGYPFGTIDPTSVDFSNVVRDKLAAVQNEAQVEVEKILSWIDETDDQLDKAVAKSNVKSVDDIEFFEGSHLTIENQKKRLLRDLSQLLGIPSRCRGGAMGDVYI